MSDTETSINENERLPNIGDPMQYNDDSSSDSQEIIKEQQRVREGNVCLYVYLLLYDMCEFGCDMILVYIGYKNKKRCRICFVCCWCILVIMVVIVLLKRMIRRESNAEIPFTDETLDPTFVPTISPSLIPSQAPSVLEWTSCQFADDVYSFDRDCGVHHCFLNMSHKPHIGVHNAWDDELRKLRNDSIYDMLAYMDTTYNELPDTIEYLRFKGNASMDTYGNKNISVYAAHITLEYLCCYDYNTSLNIINLYNNYSWDPFSIEFDRFICINDNTSKNIIVYVSLMLSQESQQLMGNWTTNFETYLQENGVDLLSKPRKDSQPFHSTFAIFNQYNQNLENISVDTVNYLNKKYSDIYRSMKFNFSKENTYHYMIE